MVRYSYATGDEKETLQRKVRMNREERERVGHLIKKGSIFDTPLFSEVPSHRNQTFLGAMPGHGDLYFVIEPNTAYELIVCQYGQRQGHFRNLYTPETIYKIYRDPPQESFNSYKSAYLWFPMGLRLAKKKGFYKGKFG
jgi:hypothetical protein